MKRFPRNRTAMAGLIVVILVLGLLMSVSTSTVLMVRTEREGQKSAQYPDQAMAAAQAGLMYYMGVLSATDTTFYTTAADHQLRIHFLSQANRNVTALATQQIATCSGAIPPGYTFPLIATSGWQFASGTTLFTADTPDLASSSLFYLKTYVDLTNAQTLASYVYVKSLGVYRVMENGVPVASHYAQINARLEVEPTQRLILINRIRRMSIQYPTANTSPIHSHLPLAW